MSKIWYYTVDGNQQGPVSAAELKQLATSGSLKPQDLVWKEGMPEWTPAKNLKGLFPVVENKAPEAKATPQPETSTEEPQGEQAFAGFDKASLKKKMKQEEPPEEEVADEGNAFAGFDKKVRSQFKRDEEEEEEEEIRPSRKSSRKSREDDEEYQDSEDDDDYPSRRRLAPHRGGMVLTFGIVSLVSSLFCLSVIPIGFGIPALMMGKKDLAAMKAKKMDRSGEGNTKVGFILGIVGMILGILELLAICAYFVFWGGIFALALGAGAKAK